MKRIITTLTLLTAAAACGGATETDLEAAFCAGLEAGAARTITATADATGAPDATDEARVDIVLPADGDAFLGTVAFEADEVGSFAFGLTQDVGLVVKDAAGQEVAIQKAVTGASTCSTLAVRYTVPMQIGRYTLTLGPATSATLGLISEESNDDL